jgi:low affinity Fe/Cu permease
VGAADLSCRLVQRKTRALKGAQLFGAKKSLACRPGDFIRSGKALGRNSSPLRALLRAGARLDGALRRDATMARARTKPKIAAAASRADVKVASAPPAARSAHGQPEKKNTWNDLFTRMACTIAHWTGKPIVFLLAAAAVIVWAATGPMFHYSDTWQLVINTSTTIVTFLMVFLIQNTQNRDTMALQLKLSELILAVNEAENKVATAEDLTDEELEALHAELHNRAETMRGTLSSRRAERAKKAG